MVYPMEQIQRIKDQTYIFAATH